MTIHQLRRRHPEFVYQDFGVDYLEETLTLSASFLLGPNIKFHPTVSVHGVPSSVYASIPPLVLRNMAFHVGLAEIPSYWKATCSPLIRVKAGYLNRFQLDWWRDFLIAGLGEFFYTNRIDFTDRKFLSILCDEEKPSVRTMGDRVDVKDPSVLVPIGGGKDSVVTQRILSSRMKTVLFSLNPTAAVARITALLAGSQEMVEAKRAIDPTLLRLNKSGYLNGHTPFSGYLAFLCTLVAALWKIPYIAVSNEASANEGNVDYLGKQINHQYSKSFEFEKDFRRYSQKFLTTSVSYFSFLRPLHELQIARLFSAHPEYFLAFRSCNVGQSADQWCGKCAKCLFVYSILYPFISLGTMKQMFGRDLFDDPSLLPLAKQLLGIVTQKPFECVGTREESVVAWFLSLCARREAGRVPYLLRFFQQAMQDQIPGLDRRSQQLLNSWNTDHAVPKQFEQFLKEAVSRVATQ